MTSEVNTVNAAGESTMTPLSPAGGREAGGCSPASKSR